MIIGSVDKTAETQEGSNLYFSTEHSRIKK